MHLHYFLFFLALLTGKVFPSQIEDCCCDTETIENNNNEFLNSILTSLRKLTYFRIFKVDLFKPCTLWDDHSMCAKPSCSIQECCQEDIPAPWRDLDLSRMEERVDTFLPEIFNPWENDDEDQWVHPGNEDQMIYVDLDLNADGYTGYKGEEAGRIWRAIYQARSNFNNKSSSDLSDQEMEDRVLYRLISGFHTLTSVMVFANYPIEGTDEFGPNLDLYKRFLHPHPEYLGNLYFDFVFLLRAVNKASHVIGQMELVTETEDDISTKQLMTQLLESDFIRNQCSIQGSFDESQMFAGTRTWMMKDFRKVFRNISEILDCVGCEKCKLHAKLEFLGLGTALKILFTKDRLTADFLQRNELIALVVTLGKYSDAVMFVNDMERLIREQASAEENVEKKQEIADSQPPRVPTSTSEADTNVQTQTPVTESQNGTTKVVGEFDFEHIMDLIQKYTWQLISNPMYLVTFLVIIFTFAFLMVSALYGNDLKDVKLLSPNKKRRRRRT